MSGGRGRGAGEEEQEEERISGEKKKKKKEKKKKKKKKKMMKKKKVMRKEVVEKSNLPDLTPGFSIQRDQSCPGPNAKRKLKTGDEGGGGEEGGWERG